MIATTANSFGLAELFKARAVGLTMTELNVRAAQTCGVLKLQQQVDSSDDIGEVLAMNDNMILGRAA